MLNTSVLLRACAVAGLAYAGTAGATVVVNFSNTIGFEGTEVHTPFDPTIDGDILLQGASSSDLAQGLTATVTYTGDVNGFGSTMHEQSAGEVVWTDGLISTVYGEGGPGGDDIDHAAFGTVTATVGEVDVDALVTFDLGGVFNLSGIDMFMGWNDSGRDESSFNVLVSSDNVNYTQIADYLKPADNTGQFNAPVVNLFKIEDDAAADIAAGVRFVQFQFTDADNGFAGLMEVDIFGTAAAIAGDTNGDGDVDNSDLQAAISNFTGPQTDPPTFTKTVAEGDNNADGAVSNVDLQAAISNFTGPLGGAPVPEPTGLALLGLGGLALARRRR